MSRRLEILVNDFKGVGSFLRSFVTSAAHGLYTPFFLSTGYKKSKKRHNLLNNLSYSEKVPIPKIIGDYAGQPFGAGFSGTFIFIQALENDLLAPLAALVVVTNTADYLYNLHKRSKEEDL
jgi:hypothetical protein